MKIALIKPANDGILGLELITLVEPLGLECIGAVLERDGHEVRIIDLRLDGFDPGMDKCERFAPDLVGFQCNFTTERYRLTRATREVRRRLPGVFTLVGGHDASRDPRWFDDPSISAVAIGDGEEIVAAIVNAVDRRDDLSGVPGMMLNTDTGQRFTPPSNARSNLDVLPLPARHLVREYADSYYINFRKPLALLETARGCPFSCNFCSVWKFHESTFRMKSAQQVVRELETIRAPNIFVTDDIFWMHHARSLEMARVIRDSGIRKFYTVQTRTDIICKFPELIDEWRACGNLAVFLGVEKVDDEGLKSVNKLNKASHNERAIEILKERDVGFTCNFIVDPSWTRADFSKLKDWIEAHGTYNSGFSILTPLPGTDLWDEARMQVTTGDWELFDIVHSVLPTTLSMEDFYEEYADLWRHALRVRYKYRGRARMYLQLVAGVASGKVNLTMVRRGWNMAKIMSQSATFLRQHEESLRRVASVA
jgi:radical SAM superfamily enzyme YgiQ (UPF0313 family)